MCPVALAGNTKELFHPPPKAGAAQGKQGCSINQPRRPATNWQQIQTKSAQNNTPNVKRLGEAPLSLLTSTFVLVISSLLLFHKLYEINSLVKGRKRQVSHGRTRTAGPAVLCLKPTHSTADQHSRCVMASERRSSQTLHLSSRRLKVRDKLLVFFFTVITG